MKKLSLSIIALSFLFVTYSSAQIDGTIDSTFNNTGIFTHDFGFQDNMNDVKIQPDQKIVCTGVALNQAFTGELKVIRLNQDGSLDNTFANNGVFTYVITSETYGVESYIRADGKIVVAGLAAITFGYYDFLLVRLNSDGSVDSTFGTNGSTVTSFSSRDDLTQAMTVQSDGKILISGTITDNIDYYHQPSIIRFTENGFVDSTFGVNGVTSIPALHFDNELTSIAIQPDGKIVAAGHFSPIFTGAMNFDILVMRVDTNGILDASFGTNGVVKTPINGGIDDAFGMTLDSAQNIVVAGFTTLPFTNTLDMVLLKYDNTGTLDPNFGAGGIVTFNDGDEDIAMDVKLQADNKIIVCGGVGKPFMGPSSFALWRYLPNGTLDNTFGSNGFDTTFIGPNQHTFNSVALQNDGKIVATGKYNNPSVGNNDIAVIRYNNALSTGEMEIANSSAFSVYPNPVFKNQIISLNLESTVNSKMEISIFDLLGNKIAALNLLNTNQTIQFQLPSNISSGVYFIKADDGKTQYNQKLLVH